VKRLLFFAGLLCPFSPSQAEEADDALARQLVSTLRDPRLGLWTRVEAARSIEKLGPKASAVVPELTAQLRLLRGREHEALQESVIDALGQMGTSARAAIPTFALASNRSTDIDQAIKRSTILILGASDSQDVGTLIGQLSSQDASIRLRVAKALGLLGPAALISIPDLVLVLGDADGDVRRAAQVALRLIQPDGRPGEAIVKSIALDLKDPDPVIRATALRALGKLGPLAISATPAIESLLGDSDPDVKRSAVDALTRVARPQ